MIKMSNKKFVCVFVVLLILVGILSYLYNSTTITGQILGGCKSDADCTNPNAPACDTTTGFCVKCIYDYHCPAQRRACINQQCYECKDDIDGYCPTRRPACIGRTCYECKDENNDYCEEPEPLCHNNNCVECIDDSYCIEPTPICADVGSDDYKCVECEYVSDCENDDNDGYCSDIITFCYDYCSSDDYTCETECMDCTQPPFSLDCCDFVGGQCEDAMNCIE